MKKSFFLLIALFLFVITSNDTLADIGPEPGYHHVSSTQEISNPDDFNEIYFIGKTYGPVGTVGPYIIKKNEVLKTGYKFHTLIIYWAPKSYIDSVGIANIKTGKVSIPGDCQGGCFEDRISDANVHIITDKLESDITGSISSILVKDSDPLIKNRLIYKVVKLNDGSFKFVRVKQILSYNNGQPDLVKNFEVNINNSAECIKINKNLTIGDGEDDITNIEVKKLQSFLTNNNYLSAGITGFFGNLTKKAVIKFQRANKISPTGFIGLTSRNKISKLTSCF